MLRNLFLITKQTEMEGVYSNVTQLFELLSWKAKQVIERSIRRNMLIIYPLTTQFIESKELEILWLTEGFSIQLLESFSSLISGNYTRNSPIPIWMWITRAILSPWDTLLIQNTQRNLEKWILPISLHLCQNNRFDEMLFNQFLKLSFLFWGNCRSACSCKK